MNFLLTLMGTILSWVILIAFMIFMLALQIMGGVGSIYIIAYLMKCIGL